MSKPKNKKKAPAKAKGAKQETATPKTTAAEASTTEKKGRVRKTPEESLVVFAFRLLPEERDAIHRAAGPAGASKFVRSLAVAAATGDETQVKEIIRALPGVTS